MSTNQRLRYVSFRQAGNVHLELPRLVNHHNACCSGMLTMITIQGPLVGQRQSSSNLTAEYATADPVYQAKTAVSESQSRRADRNKLTENRLCHRSTLTTGPCEVMAVVDGEVSTICSTLTVNHITNIY